MHRLNAEIRAVLAMPEVTGRLAEMGASAAPGSAEEFGRLIADQRTQWAEAVRAAGIRIE